MDYNALAKELFQYMMKGPKMPFQKKVNDISHGEKRILGFLMHGSRGCTSGELSEQLHLTTPRVASALKSLSKKGFIERNRDDQDRRMVIVTITEEGRAFVKQEHEKALALAVDTLKKLGEHDATEFVRIMKRITDIYKQPD